MNELKELKAIAALLVFRPDVDMQRIKAWIAKLEEKGVLLRGADIAECGEHDHPTLYFP